MKPSPCMLLALLLFVSACSKDSPVGPTASTPAPATITAVIGPSGGTLTCEGFNLSIPASAFSKAETLTVQKEIYSNSFGSLNVSDEFQLDGLPGDFTGQLQLKLKSTRTPSTGLYVGIAEEGTEASAGVSRILYDVVPASVDSGYITLKLSPSSLGRALTKSGRALSGGTALLKWFCAFDQLDTMRSAHGHFKVIHPKSSVGMATAVANDLEDAYTWFDQNGFNRGTYALSRWPMKVLIERSREFLANNLVETQFLWKGKYEPGIPDVILTCNENEWDHGEPEFRKWLFTSFAMIFCSVHDDFFHLPLRYRRILENPDAARLWPYSAITTWAGGNAHRPGYDSIPPHLPGNMLAPMHGIPLPIRIFPAAHGDGMAAFMKHLADTYGVQLLANIHHALPTASDEIDVLLEKIPEPEYIWWPAFLKRYIAGEIYAIPADTLLRDLQAGKAGSREFTIDDKTDTLNYFSDTFTDLSAKLYRVNLRYANLDPNATITFEIGPPTLNLNYVHVIVYGLKDNKLIYWDMANRVKVTQVKDLMSAGYDIVAAVINSANERPYTGSMVIDLDVKVEAEVVTLGRIKVRTTGVTQWYDGSYSAGALMLYNGENLFRKGQLTDNSFATSWSEATTVRSDGSWKITVDWAANPVKVTYFKVEETTVSASETRTWTIESSNTCAITGTVDQYGRYVFLVRGTDVGKHILPVRHRLDGTGGYWWELSATDFNNDSYIEIILE